MKNSIIKIMVVAAVALAWAGSRAYAVPITGSIGFGGTASFNNANIALATGFTSIDHEYVAGGTQYGSYTALPNLLNAGVDFLAFNWNPQTIPVYLWYVNYLGVTYRFIVNNDITATYDAQATTWNLSGSGTAYITGYDATPGKWEMSAGKSGQSISFQSTAYIPTPDGGTTALLLGLGLVGMSLAVRRFKKA